MSHPAAFAYSQMLQRTAEPRQLEAGLLLSAAARLQQLCNAPSICRADLAAAITYNVKLWAIVQASALRQRRAATDRFCDTLAELALGVFAASARLVTRNGGEARDAERDLGTLIEINRMVAIGLRAQ